MQFFDGNNGLGIIGKELNYLCLSLVDASQLQVCIGCEAFILFAPDVGLQLVERLLQHAHVVSHEVSHVVIVYFGIKERFFIGFFGTCYHTRNRQILRQPIATPQQIPIKQRARRAPIAVYKRVNVSHHKMNDDAPYQRMDEAGLFFVVEKTT